ncbi:esterase/lipase family protein [Streptomyces sp. NPDC051644]|uniref:esterase/lipase family protein n=1 Tax=Streptomyces sp. NPDC051644 TaxID=3365666 RepID=UPI0037B178BC
MSDSRLGVVMVHGIRSGPDVWDPLCRLIAQDEKLAFAEPLQFRYATGVRRLHPLRVFPTIDTVADSFKEYLATEAGEFTRLMLVTHSQGGLVAQRFLARALADGEGRRLARIRRLVMLACPNNGSELLLSLRRNVLGLGHPQERDLRPLNDQVNATLRTVLRDVVHATAVSDRTCPILVSAYAGESDRVVRAASAQSVFPDSAALPGDHSTILKAKDAGHRTFTTLRRLLLTVPDAAPEHAPEATRTPAELPGLQRTVTNTFSGGRANGPVIQGDTVHVSCPSVPPFQAPSAGLDADRSGNDDTSENGHTDRET